MLTLRSLLTLLTASTASAASLQSVSSFGSNPTNLKMQIYVPDNTPSTGAPVVLAIHYCGGSGQAIFGSTEWRSFADKYKFIVIYPSVNRSSGCFDVGTSNTLKHDGGSDSLGLSNMVKWTINQYKANTSRVFVTGQSSGGMMTEVMLGAYPDLFAAGAEFAGVPFACWSPSTEGGWNSACANGQVSKSASAWGDLVRAAYPGYTGKRPRVQLWHSPTDATINYNNFNEGIKQWTNVLGASQTPSNTANVNGWTRTQYSANGVVQVEAYSVPNAGHNVPQNGMIQYAVAFFGLDKAATSTTQPPQTTTTRPPTGTTTTTRQTTVAPTTTQGNTGGSCAAKWGQCGGQGYTGATCCTGSTCTYSNPWYSQCI